MVDKPKDTELEKTKRSVRRDIQQQIDAADYATGVKQPNIKGSKTDTNKKKKTDTSKLDIDDYLKQAEKGFVDVTPEKSDKPFNGNLNNVKITRLTEGDGKY
jgi:hypothetical protein